MEKRTCSFCGNPIEPGTGRMYVKKDGSVYHFCKTKCYKNMIYMGRVPSRTRWTQPFAKETGRQSYGKRRKGGSAPAPVEAPVPKPRKVKPALPEATPEAAPAEKPVKAKKPAAKKKAE